VQTINWGQLVAGVLPDPCRGGTLHGFAVNLIRVGTRSGHALETFLVIKKGKKKKKKKKKKTKPKHPPHGGRGNPTKAPKQPKGV
jgi:phage tail tape-measure protein